MLRLIKNEYLKIFLKKSTYIIIAVCLILALGLSALIQFAEDSMDDFFYEDEVNIETQLSWYSKDSEYIYDRAYYEVYSVYNDMGYEYESDIPSWVRNGVYDVIFSHYAYYLISQSDDVESAENEMGMILADVDVDYEKNVAEKKLAIIKKLDYIEYSQECLTYLEKQKADGMHYSQGDIDFYRYMVEKRVNPEEDDEMMYALGRYVYAKSSYDKLIADKEAGNSVSERELETEKKTYSIFQYVIENEEYAYMTEPIEDGYPVTSENKFISAITSSSNVGAMAGIFVMIVAAGIIANEFSSGTIKFLLINPVKRCKIFWSKYITCVTLLLGSMASFFVLYLLFCMILCGTDGMNGVYLSYADGAVQAQPIILYALEQYGLSVLSILVSVTLAFTVSSLMRSTAVAIAVSIVVELAGSTITSLLAGLGYDWGRYLIFANTDLVSISSGTSLFPRHSMTFALVTVAIYMVIFLLTAHDAFTKKEV